MRVVRVQPAHEGASSVRAHVSCFGFLLLTHNSHCTQTHSPALLSALRCVQELFDYARQGTIKEHYRFFISNQGKLVRFHGPEQPAA